MKTIDAKGQLCPVPLIMTKKAINALKGDEALEILIDNETSLKNVKRFLEDNGMNPTVKQTGNVYHLFVGKSATIPEHVSAEAWCSTEKPISEGYAMVFKQDKVGHGADDLGSILIKALINTLPEIDKKPRWMIFLNTSIKLTIKNSPVLESLKKLEADGVEILVCGTCLDYFGKKEELAVGHISNMYVILDSMNRADKVIHP
ncbi:MAG: sulfurtransferase-like selenium metabolism protein YedF [Bacteroidales bacterium]|nr:sulfurtransferase-like selenium metabolism protein YedF [Bacteroidales bacterium]